MADKKQSAQPRPAAPKAAHDDDVAGKAYDSRLMRRLLTYLRPYKLQTGISAVATILKSASDSLGPLLVMVAVDTYMSGAPPERLSWLARHLGRHAVPPMRGVTEIAAIYLGLLLFTFLLELLQTYLMQWTGQKVMFDMRRQIFRHLQRMSPAFFDRNPVGRLVTRLTSDVDAINEMFTAGVLAIVDDFFNLTIMAAVMLTINWRLALIAFAVLPVIFIVTRLFRDSVRESYRRVRAAIARINSFTQEHISGMPVVQLFNREALAYKDFEEVNRLHMVAFKDTIFAYALYYPAVEILSAIAIALVIWRGGFGVLNGAVTIGVLAMFIQYSQRFWRPIQDLSDKYNILQAAMAACERIFKLLDTAPEIVNPAHPIAGNGSNRIEFRHVWFTYQPLTDDQKSVLAAAIESPETALKLSAIKDIEWILKDVSFTVEPGQTIAIVGHTGAGKTTIISLMMRFYDVTAGQILLDGVDLRHQDLNALRKHFAVVLQDPFLFTGTLAENIRLGNEDITAEHLRQAARDVNVLDFIETLPKQFDEPVQERGNSLSTGQKQLINFARALAYNPHILILDEATSSVDTETELRIRGALERMVEGRTSVLIAHRLSTVQRADTILVMHKGQLREMGTHQQLLANRGLYWKLYQLQYQDQEQHILAPPSPEPSIAPAV
jgi:ATP-binding cassette subfamily B protein